jgi:hypothetical protein
VARLPIRLPLVPSAVHRTLCVNAAASLLRQPVLPFCHTAADLSEAVVSTAILTDQQAKQNYPLDKISYRRIGGFAFT